MTNFIEQLEKNCVNFSERLAVALDYKSELVTYGELWNLSGKVYAYLKAHNIGREDFVLINLPRGSKIPVAMIGIWRAGAALTITEKGYPAERVEYIRKDCNAKIVIDERIYTEMMAGESLNGYEKANPHDACYAVYTSGTTGNPKGALHEYGKLEIAIRNYSKEDKFEYGENYRYAAAFPLNFVVYFMSHVPQLYLGSSFYILSYDIVKDINAFSKFIADEKISEFFMSPSLLKIYKNVPATLRLIFTGSDNVSDIYFPNVILKNGYGMSEAAFSVSTFTVNKPYHRTPVGKNFFGLEIKILNEDGQFLKNGEQGEICFENEYFRGYINLPEQTEKVLSGGVFHTGDLGYKDENGNLIIIGRKDDMIKIHGNRVEPTEIEIVAKEILGVKNILAKGFSDVGSAFIVLYGLTSEIGDKFDEKNIPILREKLSERLPEYMIPNYYITLEKFPTNANGKVTRKLFPAPNVAPVQAEYLPPVTETEKLICQKMAEILGVEKIGRNIDFYQMGGDSLKTILLVTECSELAIESSDVYKCRTSEKLAAFIDTNKNSVADNKKFPVAQVLQEKFFPAVQKAWEDYQKSGVIRSVYSSCFAVDEDKIRKISHSPSTEITLYGKVNPVKLQAAVDKAVEICPYAAFEISKNDGLVYFGKNNLPLLVGNFEEFGTEKNNNHYVIVSYEDNKIIFNVSHILTDGFGINIFIQAVLNFYFDKSETLYSGADKFDFVADLMAQELPLPDNYTPENYKIEDCFVPPEINSAEAGKTFEYSVEMSAKKFEDFCNEYKISSQAAVSILLARAIQIAHPENRKSISLRGPVNTRIPLQVPNTFQNASVPHIFLNLNPDWLKDSLPEEAINSINQDFNRQYSYENLAAFTNWIRKALVTDVATERQKIFVAYKKQTDIFANYMGKVISDDIRTNVKYFKQKMSASYPLMVYALRIGEILKLQIIQSFESRIYLDSLLQIVK